MKTLLASLVLCVPAFGGTYLVGPNDTSFPLDTPPAGATQLEVRYQNLTCNFNAGLENLSVSSACIPTATTHYSIALKAGSVEIISSRIVSTPFTTGLSGFDGIMNFAGNSGVNWQETKTKSTGWKTYNGTPTRLAVVWDGRFIVTGGSGHMSGYNASSPTTLVEWRWK